MLRKMKLMADLSPQQEEIIRLARRPISEVENALMLLLWERSEWQGRVNLALAQLGQNPTNVSEEGGPSGHSDG